MTDTLTPLAPRSEQTEAALDNLLPRTRSQTTRENVWVDHMRKLSITNFEPGCLTFPAGPTSKPALLLSHLKAGGSSARFANLQRAKSYSCPISHLHKVFRQREENAYLAEQHLAQGGSFIAFTFTMRSSLSKTPAHFYDAKVQFRYDTRKEKGGFYEKRAALPEVWAAASARESSWEDWDFNRRYLAANEGIDRMFGGNGSEAWKPRQADIAYAGRLLSIETVITPAQKRTPDGAWMNDWSRVQHHLHLHGLIFCDLSPEELATRDLASLEDYMYRGWNTAVTRAGFTTTRSAQHLTTVEVTESDVRRQASYLAKPMALADATELVAAGQGHDADRPTRSASFSDILRDATFGVIDSKGVLHPPSKAAAWWWQNFEALCFYRHFHRTSPSLSKRYGLLAFRKRTEGDYRAKVAEVEYCAFFDRDVWKSLIKDHPEIRTQLLNLAENEGAAAVRAHLEAAGVSFTIPGEPTSPSASEAAALREERFEA